MIEVSLALLVASLGLMAVVALFPAGLEMNRKAIDETQLSIFADDVFNGLRSAVKLEDWNTLAPEALTLNATAPYVWNFPNNGEDAIEVTGHAGSGEVISYEFVAYPVVDFAARYRLTVDFVGMGNDRLYFRLELLNGPFKQFDVSDEAMVFYTEMASTDTTWN